MRCRRPRPAPSTVSAASARTSHSGSRSAPDTSSQTSSGGAPTTWLRFTLIIEPTSRAGLDEIVPIMNSSDSDRFERAYATLWLALHRADDPDLSQHERALLHHVPVEGGVQLGRLAWHLALPKSTASTLVKDLERRGFLTRRRDPLDERRLAITLTPLGHERVRADSVLDPAGLAEALEALAPAQRTTLVEGLELLAETAAARRGGRRRPPPGA